MKDQQLIVRLATIDDARELADLHNDIIREEYDAVYSSEALSAWANNDEDKWRSIIAAPVSRFVLALIGNKIIGAAGLIIGKQRLGVYVLPAWHEQGVGRKLANKAFDIAREAGIEKLKLSTPAAAVPFYLRVGYVVVAESQHVFDNGATMPVFEMEITL